MNCKQTTKTMKINWGQIMINSQPSSSLSEPKINCALTPIVSAGVQFNIHSNNYIIERLSIRPLQAVEEHFDLVIDRQYLTAKKSGVACPVSLNVPFARFKKLAICAGSTTYLGDLT